MSPFRRCVAGPALLNNLNDGMSWGIFPSRWSAAREASGCDLHRSGTWTGSESFISAVRIENIPLRLKRPTQYSTVSTAYKSIEDWKNQSAPPNWAGGDPSTSRRDTKRARFRAGYVRNVFVERLFDEFPEKPVGMHWQTYDRLRRTYDIAEERSMVGLSRYVERVG